MDEQQKRQLESEICAVVQGMQRSHEGWVPLAEIGGALGSAGISYRTYGYEKLRPFLEEFQNILEFHEVQEPGKTPVFFVKPRGEGEPELPADRPKPAAAEPGKQKVPTSEMHLTEWTFVPWALRDHLAELCLPEKWYYGDQPEPGKELSILNNYLDNTFRRLCYEGKVVIRVDPANGEEYAAFNTGLVDRKYEYIYALMQKNTRADARQYWFLLDFVVAGEDRGKTLVSLFNPLPQRADYFQNKIENMLYDPSTGDLSCDYIHILTERTYRLPAEFLQENCPADFLEINGVRLEEVSDGPFDYEKKQYFYELGQKIRATPRILNRLKNRMADAVDLALKRVTWNYKTAIPMYYPKHNSGSLLLPLALMDEGRVDLALVVERQPSGAYQGQTILTLDMAYTDSRLVARPDSDWLRTDDIHNSAPDLAEV